jgi:hypothetical protein
LILITTLITIPFTPRPTPLPGLPELLLLLLVVTVLRLMLMMLLMMMVVMTAQKPRLQIPCCLPHP